MPPKFKDIKEFREEYGLEVVFPVANEIELDERIFNLIGAWHNPFSPAGQVARASWQRWGVPLRPEDVAELDYRERYVSTNAKLLSDWAESSGDNTYAGYYVDHRTGGTFHIGFTQGQEERLDELQTVLPLAALDRLATYPVQPAASLSSLAGAYSVVENALSFNSTLSQTVTSLAVEEDQNALSIGSTDVSATAAAVSQEIGSQVPVDVHPGEQIVRASGRYRSSGRMRAGDKILNGSGGCTAAFGAFEERERKANEQGITARFVLTAGHCFKLDANVFRSERADYENPGDWAKVGQATRRALDSIPFTDGEAIRTLKPDIVPHVIFGEDGNPVPVGSATTAESGETLCYSGIRRDGVSCGPVKRATVLGPIYDREGMYIVDFKHRVDHGDSGSPVWNPKTERAVGIVLGYIDGTSLSLVTPLLRPRRLSPSTTPGLLHQPAMFDLHIITGE